MNNSRYQKRAEKIHGENYKTQPPKDDVPMRTYWENNVKSKEDIIRFYNLYYPALPEVLVQALATHIQAQVDGTIAPTEQFYKHSKTNREIEERKWDYKDELQKEKFKGQMAVAERRLSALLTEES